MDFPDIIALLLAPGGILVILVLWLRDRKKLKNANIKEEKMIPLEVRAVSATTFEAEIAALRKSFDQDRAVKDNTIRDLKAENEEKDRKIDDLERRLEALQTRFNKLRRDFTELQDQFDELTRELQNHREGRYDNG